jgi:uncharacterized FAD-dependent dehydrogenase
LRFITYYLAGSTTMTLRILDLCIKPGDIASEAELPHALAQQLGIDVSEITALSLRKKSIDARKKKQIKYLYQIDFDVADEAALLRTHGSRLCAVARKAAPDLLGEVSSQRRFRHPPIIVGSGPAGIFAAYLLARAGVPALILERGEGVEARMRTVNRLRRDGNFTAESNFCYGEGGAGTFSDGKLTCGRNHPMIEEVFRTFVQFGAPAEIMYQAHPHIGTDYLMKIALSMRHWLQERGTEFRFNTCFEGFTQGASDARFRVQLRGGESLATDHLILAIGHSARDTYQNLLDAGLAMTQKPFAMGLRVEHPQEAINDIQYGRGCDLPLPVAEYKLAAHTGDGRGIWTFCMCPGGHLLPTSAEEGHLAINGMSYHARNSGFANAALVVNVLRGDYDRGHVLDGVTYQRQVERASFIAGGSNYHSPAQRLTDFLQGSKSPDTGLRSTYRPGITSARLDQVLPPYLVAALRVAIQDYDKKMRGFITKEAIVAGVESKTSAPISMPRGSNLQSLSHPGLFPCGEGAGFAGGIVSAALDGLRVAQALLLH